MGDLKKPLYKNDTLYYITLLGRDIRTFVRSFHWKLDLTWVFFCVYTNSGLGKPRLVLILFCRSGNLAGSDIRTRQ